MRCPKKPQNVCAYVCMLLLLLLLSRVSRVRLCATPKTAAQQAPLSLGFSRQEHWSGLPFPSPIMKVKSKSEVAQSCPTLSDLMDCNLPGSSIHGIFQVRLLELGAIAFSDMCVYIYTHTHTYTHMCVRSEERRVGKEC